MRRFPPWRFLLLLGLACLSPVAAATPRIGLVTMAPGDVYWSRFGHNAILVAPENGPALLYNYGYFDFDEPGFLLRFLRGQMRYRLVALPLESDLASYDEEGRGVYLQWLALAPTAAKRLAGFLAWNAKPENAYYRYDYFTDNCSTRVRDALDRAVDGQLQKKLTANALPVTYRSESLRLSAGDIWLYLGIHAGLGPYTDHPLTEWQAAFVPMRLAEAIKQVQIDGHPLVESGQPLLPHRLAAPLSAPPPRLIGFLWAGILLAVALIATLSANNRRWRWLGAGLAAAFWLLSGLGGLVLLGLWLGSEHIAAWRNQNLLLFDPLTLLLLPAAAALARKWNVRFFSHAVAAIVAFLIMVAWVLKLVPLEYQANAEWIALMLPPHLVLAFQLMRHRRPEPLEPLL